MGATQRTIGQDGCTITCLSMVADKNPSETNKVLTQHGGYTNGNLVSWQAACTALGLKFIYRYRTYDNQVAIDAISKYGFVLAEVDFDGNPKTTGKHWVKLNGNHLLDDPNSLTIHPEPTSKYKDYTGLAVIQKP